MSTDYLKGSYGDAALKEELGLASFDVLDKFHKVELEKV